MKKIFFIFLVMSFFMGCTEEDNCDCKKSDVNPNQFVEGWMPFEVQIDLSEEVRANIDEKCRKNKGC